MCYDVSYDVRNRNGKWFASSCALWRCQISWERESSLLMNKPILLQPRSLESCHIVTSDYHTMVLRTTYTTVHALHCNMYTLRTDRPHRHTAGAGRLGTPTSERFYVRPAVSLGNHGIIRSAGSDRDAKQLKKWFHKKLQQKCVRQGKLKYSHSSKIQWARNGYKKLRLQEMPRQNYPPYAYLWIAFQKWKGSTWNFLSSQMHLLDVIRNSGWTQTWVSDTPTWVLTPTSGQPQVRSGRSDRASGQTDADAAEAGVRSEWRDGVVYWVVQLHITCSGCTRKSFPNLLHNLMFFENMWPLS